MLRIKVSTLIQCIFTILIFIYLLSKVNASDLLTTSRDVKLHFLIAGTAILALQPIFGAVRWCIILHALRSQYDIFSVLRWNYVGVFFGQALPSMVGTDAIRIWLAVRGQIGWRNSIVSVMLDRILMLIFLAALLLFGVHQIGEMLSAPWLVWLIPLSLVAGTAGIVLLFLANYIPEHLNKHRPVRAVRFLSDGARMLAMQPLVLTLNTIFCALSYLGLIASVFIYTQAFGAKSDPLQVLILLPPVLMASMAPFSLGGWGTRELAMVGALGLADIPADIALLTSIWLGISSILIALPGMVFSLLQRIDLGLAQSINALARIKDE